MTLCDYLFRILPKLEISLVYCPLTVSNDDYQPQPQSSPRGSITAHDEPVRRLYPHEPYTLHQNYIDAGLRRQGAAYEVAPDWDRTRQVAHSRVRLLHKQ
jgi:hypothetical protein